PFNASIADHKMGPLGWEVLQDMEVVLEVPAHAQHTMCGGRMLLLHRAILSYEVFLAQWTNLSSACNHPQLAPFISSGLELANYYHDCLQCSNAYLFAMFVDPCIQLSWVEEHWEVNAIVTTNRHS
ncbi:hypothetical protein PAXRUDRAFT_160780, partial [Paxillus rubicundulus Ve08.2h10]